MPQPTDMEGDNIVILQRRIDELEVILDLFRAERVEAHIRPFRENFLPMPAQVQQATHPALDSGEDTTKLLKEARAELAQVRAERDELRAQIARGGSYKPERARRIEPQAVDDGGTINALMTDSSWIRERKAAAEGHLEAKVSVEDDSPSVDLLDPSLVFTKGKRDDDEE